MVSKVSVIEIHFVFPTGEPFREMEQIDLYRTSVCLPATLTSRSFSS